MKQKPIIAYICTDCGYTQCFRQRFFNYNCPKCGGFMFATGAPKLNIPPVTEEQYLNLVKNNKWEEYIIKNEPVIWESINRNKAKQAAQNSEPDPSQPTPKCPTCGSTNIRRISTAEKAVNAGMFGLLGNKRTYQFECMNPNCKYKW